MEASKPVKFKLGKREYRVEWSDEPIIGQDGDALTHRLDVQRRVMVLSPDCDGRFAVGAVCQMFINARLHEAGQPLLSDEDTQQQAASAEAFLLSMGIEEGVLSRLKRETAHKPRPKVFTRRSLGLLGVAASLALAVIASYWWASGEMERSGVAINNPDQVELVPADAGIRDLLADRTPQRTLFDPPAVAVAAHPTRPGFVVADAGKQVLYVEHPMTRRLLLITDTPVFSLHVSASGERVAASEWGGLVHDIDLDASRPVKTHRAPGQLSRVFAVRGGVAGNLRGGGVWFSSPELTADSLHHASSVFAPASSMTHLATVEDSGNTQVLRVMGTNGSVLLTRVLFGDQELMAFDVNEAGTRAVLSLNDGAVAFYGSNNQNGLSILRELNYGSQTLGEAWVRVSESGHRAWVNLTRLIEFDFEHAKPLASAETTTAVNSSFLTRTYQDTDGGRVLVSDTHTGVVYR